MDGQVRAWKDLCVHRGARLSLGSVTGERPEVEDYEAEVTSKGVVALDVRIFQPDPDASGQGAVLSYTYRVFRSLTAYFSKTSAGPSFAALFSVTPVEDAVMAQDIPVVESQRPELLPLDLQAELHLRSDRAAIAYRKYLKACGVRLGVS